jgi:hypothetical protein
MSVGKAEIFFFRIQRAIYYRDEQISPLSDITGEVLRISLADK